MDSTKKVQFLLTQSVRDQLDKSIAMFLCRKVHLYIENSIISIISSGIQLFYNKNKWPKERVKITTIE